MRRDFGPSTRWRDDGGRLDPSKLAGRGSRAASDETVAPLTLSERVLLSVGLQAVCLVVQADHLVARMRLRGGDGRAVRETARPGW
jgi:hypothetical protein